MTALPRFALIHEQYSLSFEHLSIVEPVSCGVFGAAVTPSDQAVTVTMTDSAAVIGNLYADRERPH